MARGAKGYDDPWLTGRYHPRSVTDTINGIVKKKSFQREGGEVLLVGIEGDVTYGQRTKYEWLALVEDIDRGVATGVILHRPKNKRVSLGLGRIVALHHRPSTIYRNSEHIRRLLF